MIKTEFDGYGRENVERDIGGFYTIIIWHECAETVHGEIKIDGTHGARFFHDWEAKAVVLTVPVEADDAKTGITIEQLFV